jgi:hypothetical protein
MWDLWWTKWHWDSFSTCTSVFHRKFHSTGAPLLEKTQIIFITGLHNKPQDCGASVTSAAGPFTKKKGLECVHIRISFTKTHNQDRQCTYNVTLRRVRITIAAVEKK